MRNKLKPAIIQTLIMGVASLRLVQLAHPTLHRRVALVSEPNLVLLQSVQSVYNLALQAIETGKKFPEIINEQLTEEVLNYDAIYKGESDWKLLPCFDHPDGPFGCCVSGTGLTHKNSALNREIMHQANTTNLTDSMKMYQWGVEGGSPLKGNIGVQPEWFYKGNGLTVRAHGETLSIPVYGNDGGEEPEIAGIYIVDADGRPCRIGFCTANEFSDHVMEKKNYLYLAPSKLRQCAIGPELVIDEDFMDLTGTVKIVRGNEEVWSADTKTGQNNMAHSVQNLEHHHFKFACNRIPMQAHIHFFGADAFSFGKIALQQGDVMQVEWKGMGRPLQNMLAVEAGADELIEVRKLN